MCEFGADFQNNFITFELSVRKETSSAGMQLASAKSVTTNYVEGLPLEALFFGLTVLFFGAFVLSSNIIQMFQFCNMV